MDIRDSDILPCSLYSKGKARLDTPPEESHKIIALTSGSPFVDDVFFECSFVLKKAVCFRVLFINSSRQPFHFNGWFDFRGTVWGQ